MKSCPIFTGPPGVSRASGSSAPTVGFDAKRSWPMVVSLQMRPAALAEQQHVVPDVDR